MKALIFVGFFVLATSVAQAGKYDAHGNGINSGNDGDICTQKGASAAGCTGCLFSVPANTDCTSTPPPATAEGCVDTEIVSKQGSVCFKGVDLSAGPFCIGYMKCPAP